MELLTTKNINEMTLEERIALRNQLNEKDMEEMRKQVEEVVDAQKKVDGKISLIEQNYGEHEKSITELKEQTNVLCAPIHRKRRKQFCKKAASRVKFLLGNDNTSPEYILFSSYFFKGIYSDIAYQLEIGNWDDVSMEKYDSPNSDYEQAKEIRDEWRPNYKYYKRCLSELIAKRDNGNLRKDRCIALTAFLNSTNNGESPLFL